MSPAASSGRAEPRRIVAVGGGTGLPELLAALKPEGSSPPLWLLTAVVTVTDDGGSSGRLRRSLGTLPPGDIRNCLVALSDAPEVFRNLFQHRFSQGELGGHSLGNLLIAGLADITGDFATAVSRLHTILAIRGRIVPSTPENVQLVAETVDGERVRGESAIAGRHKAIARLMLDPEGCRAVPEARRALAGADVVLLGPGSLYTSVLPNLLVGDLAKALADSSAKIIYLCNLTTQPGETEGFRASDHLQALLGHVPGLRVDAVLCNNAPLPAALAEAYSRTRSRAVEVDAERIETLGSRAVLRDLLAAGTHARHDRCKLRSAILELMGVATEVA